MRTKQWLVLDASAFQCMRAGFLCPKCDNFVCLHTRQDHNDFHLKSCCVKSNVAIFPSDGELRLMALHTHFLPKQYYSRVYALFLAFQALAYRWGCQFLSLFSQDNEHTDLTVLLFFQNPKFSHTFRNITMIFKVMLQYIPALFKRIQNYIHSAEKKETLNGGPYV